jgi:hypothetical protein
MNLGLTYIGCVALLPGSDDSSSQVRLLARPATTRMAKPRQFLGVTPRRWLEYLVAILLGNAIYYFSLAPHLPGSLRHQGFAIDPGMLLDFVICVGVYGLIRLGFRLNAGSFDRPRER